MSIPNIPGYIGGQLGRTLGAVWDRPAGNYPDELWPVGKLSEVDPSPTGWLTVVEHFFDDEAHGGTGCILVPSDEVAAALSAMSWIGQDLGKVWVSDDGSFDNGLVAEDSPHVEFFAQARPVSGTRFPQIEIAYPFLWYWDAFSVADGWRYLNRAGREQEIIRFERSKDHWKVQVRALELREFLAVYSKVAIVQIDHVTKAEESQFDRVADEHTSVWAHFVFHAICEGLTGARPAFSRLLGKYAVSGTRAPGGEERRRQHDYPTFIYGVDAETGEPLVHTCNPDQLGTYFDKEGTRLHYLTPIYFRREVLQPYIAEPARYTVSALRLACLDRWGISISFNSAGLVEVYLGDIGRDLPSDEWGHWRTYNVPPEGHMNEGRFRRDFLNQWSSSTDPVDDLRRARRTANAAAKARFGKPLWRPLPEVLDAEYQSLIGPLNDDPSALGAPLLILTKVFVDALDPAPLRGVLEQSEKGEQSLGLLQRCLNKFGDTDDSSQILRNLQGFRSRGGIAHLANSQSARAAAILGIDGLGSLQAFTTIVTRLTVAMNQMAELLDDRTGDLEPDGNH